MPLGNSQPPQLSISPHSRPTAKSPAPSSRRAGLFDFMGMQIMKGSNVTTPMPHTSMHPERARPALKLVKTNQLGRDEWLAVRKGGIGSSDAAAAVGLNPYKSALELWMEKTGRDVNLPRVDPQDETSPMYWGTLLEPIVAAHYTKRTGNRVRRVNTVLQHPTEPWMLANLDREVLGCSDVQILECKTAGINGARLWADGVPEYVQLQVMHQLAVTGKHSADVAVLIGGQELRIHRIERDDTQIRHLMILERNFWGYVERDEPPPVDGSDSSDAALRALYPHDSGDVLDLSADLAMQATFSDLLAVRQLLESQEKLHAQLMQSIQQRMGEASKAVFDGGSVTWKRSKDSHRFDLDRLRAEMPETAQRYTSVREGSRRFLVSPKP